MKIMPIIPIPIITIITLVMIIINRNDIIKISIIILLFIINLRPIITADNNTNNINILFIVDTTYSMNDKVHNIRKIDIAKEDINNITNNFENTNISIITFDNSSKIIIPYTNNKKYINERLNILDTISKNQANGSSLNKPLNNIKKNIINNETIIIFLTDGETTIKENYNGYKKIKNKIKDGFIIEYNKKNSSTKLLEKSLNIKRYNFKDKSNINSKINQIKNNSLKYNNSIETYYIFIIPLIILLLIEITNYRRYL